MSTPPPSREAHRPGGARFSDIVGSALSLLQTRLEILGIEFAEEKARLLGVMFVGLAAMLFGMLALIAFTGLIAVLFWDTYRWQALCALTLLYLLIAVICAVRARAAVRSAPGPFEATLSEFRRDKDMLQ